MFNLGMDRLTSEILVHLSCEKSPSLQILPEARQRLRTYREIVNSAIEEGRTIYGINTGFGFLSDVKIANHQLEELQVNLIRSHACGVGDFLNEKNVRALLISRCHNFLLGHSGVSEECVEKIIEFLKHDILPLVPSKGSVGASGDLAPLAHLALGLIGEGECFYLGERRPVKDVLKECGLKPLNPQAKEGLALINGTQVMTTLAAQAVIQAKILLESSIVISCLSLDAVRGTKVAFDSRIQNIRPHPGQIKIAKFIQELFSSHDDIMLSHKDCGKVQDPYSFRCIPQVHGASLDAIEYVCGVVDTELNSITDNPLVFDNGDIISGGNFHGQPVALATDFLAIAVAELGNIAERRIEKMTNPALSGLPSFIIDGSGLNSGFMIPQVVAASLVSENKVLCHPASVDSIPTSADKEDHVSMGTIAARKALEVNKNVAHILAIELLSACQGIELLGKGNPSLPLTKVWKKVRQICPFLLKDRSLHKEIVELSEVILNGSIIKWAEVNLFKKDLA